jgi:uncharacterized protein YndB with AHSA1/START domain
VNEAATLRIERTIRAPVEDVFDAFTVPEQFAAWWGPEGTTIPDYSMDVRPGGAWRTVMKLPDGNMPEVSGVYRAVEKNKRLVFTWAWKQPDGSRGHETEVTITFEPVPGGTRMVLLQQVFQSEEARDSHGTGWRSSFDALEKWIARR